MSFIIPIFVLLVVKSETGPRHTRLVEGGLQPAYIFLKVGACWSPLGPHCLKQLQCKDTKNN
jgi:hypothetical protein